MRLIEHLEHAAHGGGHDHGEKHGRRFSFTMLVGITMAMLGAFSTFAGG